MKLKEAWEKFLITLGYIFIAAVSGLVTALVWISKRKKVTDENLDPGSIIDSLPNSAAVRRRISDFGTAGGNSAGRKSDDVGSRRGVHDNRSGGGDTGILAGWVEGAERMGVPGTSKVVRIRDSGSTKGADESS